MSESWQGFLRRMAPRHPEASILRSIGGYNASDTGKQIRDRAARPEGRHGHLTADEAQRFLAMRDEWQGVHKASISSMEDQGSGVLRHWTPLGEGGRQRVKHINSD